MRDPAAFFGALAAPARAMPTLSMAWSSGRSSRCSATARFVDDAPWLSDYSFQHIYYRSLLEHAGDYLRVRTTCGAGTPTGSGVPRTFGAQHPLVRRLLGPSRLNSRTYTRIMRWNARWGLTRRLARWRGRTPSR